LLAYLSQRSPKMSERSLNIQLRLADVKDIPFLFSAWLKSYRVAKAVESIHNNIYYAEHHKVLEHILQHFQVLIASDKSDDSHIYGFAVGGKIEGINTIHYVYVKQTFRRLGIASALLKHFEIPQPTPFFYTHETPVGKSMAKKLNGIYHPYLINKKPSSSPDHKEA